MDTDRTHQTDEVPVQPEIPRSQFARGMARRAQDPDRMHLGEFAEGQRTASPPASGPHRGRFSEGQERLGDDDPEKHIRRRYSEGLESRHTA
jgi:hypothetical protein